jgi:probable HAF family extracellular repeat protein
MKIQRYHVAHASQITDLGTLGGSFSYANGINASGLVVGFSSAAGDATVGAFLYSGGVMTNLGALGGSASAANGTNASGQAVGYSSEAGNAAEFAYLYSGGVMTNPGAGVDRRKRLSHMPVQHHFQSAPLPIASR